MEGPRRRRGSAGLGLGEVGGTKEAEENCSERGERHIGEKEAPVMVAIFAWLKLPDTRTLGLETFLSSKFGECVLHLPAWQGVKNVSAVFLCYAEDRPWKYICNEKRVGPAGKIYIELS